MREGKARHRAALWDRVSRRGDELLVVSDESKKLARYDLSERGLSLKRTWKLGRRRAEGIAVVGDRIYVLFDDTGTNLRWYERPEP